MLNRQTITIYNQAKINNNETYIRTVIPNVYVEDKSLTNIMQPGLLEKYKKYLSIPYSTEYKPFKEYNKLQDTEKSHYYTLEPKKTYIVLSYCDIDISNYDSKAKFLEDLTELDYVMVSTVDDRLHCSRSMWHIEVGAV